ncbi:A/G-specific adenine glycosylase [Candidatus Berkelbacteria bacterium]|nr:A/G-specific adenine glycosylase [Candidatus Berkelbacteria bacterium]
MTLSRQTIQSIQTRVLDWYRENKRDLPWRKIMDPYRILVSEMMLQQTQVARVIPKYENFLALFPTIAALAAAPSSDVIRAWKGLGYNRRALNLQRSAQQIVTLYDGRLPSDLKVLRSFPGIGRYTAGAIRNFAFGLDTPAVDTNVKQFLDHFVPNDPKDSTPHHSPSGEVSSVKERASTPSIRSENNYYELAQQLIPKGKAKEWLHAVMDYSALVLKPNQTSGSTLRVKPRKTEAFMGSNRYVRGRIIDWLRDKPQTRQALFTAIAKPIDLTEQRFDALLETLEQEGFLTHRQSTLRLVE